MFIRGVFAFFVMLVLGQVFAHPTCITNHIEVDVIPSANPLLEPDTISTHEVVGGQTRLCNVPDSYRDPQGRFTYCEGLVVPLGTKCDSPSSSGSVGSPTPPASGGGQSQPELPDNIKQLLDAFQAKIDYHSRSIRAAKLSYTQALTDCVSHPVKSARDACYKRAHDNYVNSTRNHSEHLAHYLAERAAVLASYALSLNPKGDAPDLPKPETPPKDSGGSNSGNTGGSNTGSSGSNTGGGGFAGATGPDTGSSGGGSGSAGSGSGGNGSGSGNASGNGGGNGHFEDKNDVSDFCKANPKALACLNAEGLEDDGGDLSDLIPRKEIPISFNPGNGILGQAGAGVCPAPETVSLRYWTFVLDWASVCQFLAKIRGIVIAIFSVFGMFIIFRGMK